MLASKPPACGSWPRTDRWTAFVPFAARWLYELHRYPNRRVPDLASLTPEVRAEFPALHVDLLRRLDRLFDERTPYIAAVHTRLRSVRT